MTGRGSPLMNREQHKLGVRNGGWKTKGECDEEGERESKESGKGLRRNIYCLEEGKIERRTERREGKRNKKLTKAEQWKDSTLE